MVIGPTLEPSAEAGNFVLSDTGAHRRTSGQRAQA
jgi:hypothetical protein